jgi:hypothetical protein
MKYMTYGPMTIRYVQQTCEITRENAAFLFEVVRCRPTEARAKWVARRVARAASYPTS